MNEKSFVMLKPDAVLRRLTGKILTRFEDRGLQILAAKMMVIPRKQAEEHYAEHNTKPFFAICWLLLLGRFWPWLGGDECINLIRKMVGATNPKEADLGTIRGDFAIQTGRNIVHASDSPESAERKLHCFSKMMKSASISFLTRNGIRRTINFLRNIIILIKDELIIQYKNNKSN